MIRARIQGVEVDLDDYEWEQWVLQGLVPPNTPVLSSGGAWVAAAGLPGYRELMGWSPLVEPLEQPNPLRVIFPKKGISATELFVLINVAVTAWLVFWWREAYLGSLRHQTRFWWEQVHQGREFWWWIPTLFMHAGPGHLFRNMIALVPSAGALEYLVGRRWTVVMYFATGLAGTAWSYCGHHQPPLSVGASGAVFGLAGAVLGFLIRRHKTFSFRQRWKTRRVYIPMFVILVGQSLLNADYLAHTGGFVAGVLLGLILPPHRRITASLTQPET